MLHLYKHNEIISDFYLFYCELTFLTYFEFTSIIAIIAAQK